MTHGGGERDGLNDESEEGASTGGHNPAMTDYERGVASERERQRNAMAFTYERFRQLIPTEEEHERERERERERARRYVLSEEARIIARRNEIDPNITTGRLQYYDEILPERSDGERIQYLMSITRETPPPERQEEEAEAAAEEPSEFAPDLRAPTRDLELIANHANVASLNLPADLVALAYEENDGDIVNAIMELTEPVLRRRLEQQLAERARLSSWIVGNGGGDDDGTTDEEDEEEERDEEAEAHWRPPPPLTPEELERFRAVMEQEEREMEESESGSDTASESESVTEVDSNAEEEEIRREARRQHLETLASNRRVSVDTRDILLLMSQMRVSEVEATAALVANDGDLFNAAAAALTGETVVAEGGAEEAMAQAEVAIVQAEEALSRSEEAVGTARQVVVYSADWLPHYHDWNRLAATSVPNAFAGQTQHQRDTRLGQFVAEVEQNPDCSLHDAAPSSFLRDLLYPTLEWRMAWARERSANSTRPWCLPDMPWYRVMAMMQARYPDDCRRSDPYRGQPLLPTDRCPELLWLECLKRFPDALDPPNGERIVRQQRRTEEVKGLLADLGGRAHTQTRSPCYVRNRIRWLMRDTMANLVPHARQWPDPIWAHVLRCVRKWDEEMLTMRTTQRRAMQLRNGAQDAEIEAMATLMRVRDSYDVYTSRGYYAAHRAAQQEYDAARDARENAGVIDQHTWSAGLQQWRDEIASAEVVATAAEFGRVEAEGAARRVAAAGARATFGAATNRLQRASADSWVYARPRPWVDQTDLTKRREALEEQMEQGELTEYEYLKRMNALRDEYRGATPPRPPPPVRAQRGRTREDHTWLGFENHIMVTNYGPLALGAYDSSRVGAPSDDEPPAGESEEVD